MLLNFNGLCVWVTTYYRSKIRRGDFERWSFGVNLLLIFLLLMEVFMNFEFDLTVFLLKNLFFSIIFLSFSLEKILQPLLVLGLIVEWGIFI